MYHGSKYGCLHIHLLYGVLLTEGHILMVLHKQTTSDHSESNKVKIECVMIFNV